MRIEIVVSTGTGISSSSAGEIVFKSAKEFGGDNPRYQAHEAWEQGGQMLSEVVRQIERQYGPRPDDEQQTPPTVFAKPVRKSS